MGLLSAIFGNGKPEENQQEKQTQKNFEILKYDGIRAHNMNQLAYAAKCLEQASALRDDAETLQYLADTYVKLQRTDDARTTLDKLTGLEPDNIQGYLFLANVCFAQEDYDGMDKACQKAIKLDESNAHAYYLAARAAHGLHNDLQAIVMATKAITQDESFLSAYKSGRRRCLAAEKYRQSHIRRNRRSISVSGPGHGNQSFQRKSLPAERRTALWTESIRQSHRTVYRSLGTDAPERYILPGTRTCPVTGRRQEWLHRRLEKSHRTEPRKRIPNKRNV